VNGAGFWGWLQRPSSTMEMLPQYLCSMYGGVRYCYRLMPTKTLTTTSADAASLGPQKNEHPTDCRKKSNQGCKEGGGPSISRKYHSYAIPIPPIPNDTFLAKQRSARARTQRNVARPPQSAPRQKTYECKDPHRGLPHWHFPWYRSSPPITEMGDEIVDQPRRGGNPRSLHTCHWGRSTKTQTGACLNPVWRPTNSRG